MSGKQHRIARREAYSIATTKNLWSKCMAFAPKYLRFFAKFFKRFSRKLSDRTAKLYRYNIDKWSKIAYASRPGTVIYRENQEFARVQRKLEKARAKKRLAEIEKSRNLQGA